MRRMMLGHRVGDDVAEHVQATHQYAEYDHVLRGFEMSSALIAPNPHPAPELEDPVRDFRPLVRSGWRAPHVWVDAAETESVLDWFGSSYVLVLGPDCDLQQWEAAVAQAESVVPIKVRQLPTALPVAPYESDAIVLVRPDGIIAQRVRQAGATSIADFQPYLPATG